MSRILLNNKVVLQCASAASTASTGISTCKTSSHVVRRWKSLLHYNQKQRQLGAVSTAKALNARGNSKLFVAGTTTATTQPLLTTSGTTIEYCRTASSSSTAALIENNKNQVNSSSSNKPQQQHMSTMPAKKCLQIENINPNFITMEYAVRGPLVIRAGEIEKELQKGVKKPFDQVIRANIGDCHAMGQKPLHFVRQLLALTIEPELLKSPDYPEDVKKRARAILDGCQGHSVGSYTDSAGLEVVRRQVADFIQRRDGLPSDWHNIFLTAGATPGIKSVISLLHCKVNGKAPGIMVPIPQYPLYSATIAEYGMNKVDYYLEEETNWSLSRKELQRSYDESLAHCQPRALVVINPGNPTGQVLKHENIVEIIKFAYDNKLVLLADEVYQDNIYDKDSKFYSFKKVLAELGAPYKDMELVSFLSTSKGFLGECGIRGGYMEVLNMCPQVMAMLAKSITASLCGTTAGQVAVSALVNPPQPGEPSYEQYISEKTNILKNLKERAELVYNTFKSFDGFKINVVQGAMYAFPQIEIPPKAVAAAKAKNMTPDTFYAFELLEATGICIVSGSGFGQKPGTYHFRTTILPQTGQLKVMLQKFKEFHIEFMKKYK